MWKYAIAAVLVIRGMALGSATDHSTLEARSDAETLLDRGIRHMGGQEALEAVHQVRFDMMTAWQRTSFDDVPSPGGQSFEQHVDVRDYRIPAWRNTRLWGFGGTMRTIVNVIRDSVAITDLGQGPRPLSIAYVDERRELFAYTPDRLMLWARGAPDLRADGDTVVANVPHTRVTATVNGIPMTLYLRSSDGLPSLVRFRRGALNDFGLVPWGVMDVDVWYSLWHSYPEGISIPTQWDILRAGAAYKRMTVLNADFHPDFAPDSFAVTPEQRAAYLSSPAVRPMHDRALDSARVVDGFLADFRSFGSPAGAVRMGKSWLLLEAGQAPLNAARALEWLEANTEYPVAGAVLGAASSTLLPHGGLPELLGRGIPTVVGPAASRLAQATLEGYGRSDAALDVARTGRWLVQSGDSAWVEPLDLPDVRGALVVWFPGHRWLYAPDAFTALDRTLVLELADERGWDVARMGSIRGILQVVP